MNIEVLEKLIMPLTILALYVVMLFLLAELNKKELTTCQLSVKIIEKLDGKIDRETAMKLQTQACL